MNISIWVDLVALVFLAGCVFYYYKKGFAAALVDWIGAAISVVIALVVGNTLGPIVFNGVFRTPMQQQAAQTIAEQGTGALESFLKGILFFVPDSVLQPLVASLQTGLAGEADMMATQVVDTAIAPFVVPVLISILFIVVFALAMLLLGMLSKALVKANKIPVLGETNMALGAVMGALVGILYSAVLGMCLWGIAAGGTPALGSWSFADSLLYRLVAQIMMILQQK